MPLDTDIEGFFETYVVSSPDGKNRVTVPKDIRDVLGDNTFTLYAPSNEPELLYLIPDEFMKEKEERLRRESLDIDVTESSFRLKDHPLVKHSLSHVSGISFDGNGRIVVPYGELGRSKPQKSKLVFQGLGKSVAIYHGSIEDFRDYIENSPEPDPHDIEVGSD